MEPIQVNSQLLFRLLLIVSFASIRLAAATQHTVGGNIGWTLTSINFTEWAQQQAFYVDDTLLFPYQLGAHSVFQVTEAAFTSCSISSPIRAWANGNTIVTVSTPGNYWFICGFPGHCTAGMKMAINVLVKSSTSPPSSTPPPSSSPRTPPPPASMTPKSPPAAITPISSPPPSQPSSPSAPKDPPSPSPPPPEGSPPDSSPSLPAPFGSPPAPLNESGSSPTGSKVPKSASSSSLSRTQWTVQLMLAQAVLYAGIFLFV